MPPVSRIFSFVLGVALLVMSTVGCGTVFHEKYHFKAERPGEQPNYFRVTIKGHALFSQSQYASGLYDKAAVDALFGELQGAKVTATKGLSRENSTGEGQAGGGALPGAASGGSGGKSKGGEADDRADKATLKTLQGEPVEGQRLVFFLSANSNAIVDQIKAYVRNQQVQQAMVTLILQDETRDLARARAIARPQQARADELASALEEIAARMENGQSPLASPAATVEALNILAASSSAPDPSPAFDSLTSAIAWKASHPDAFEREGVR